MERAEFYSNYISNIIISERNSVCSMKKNIIVVAFYVCLVIIVITSFCKNKKDDKRPSEHSAQFDRQLSD